MPVKLGRITRPTTLNLATPYLEASMHHDWWRTAVLKSKFESVPTIREERLRVREWMRKELGA